ncbi:MAG: cyclopropane-fatty-acyl-phospholipid synthase family protein [Gammaproteobacteria bacterium]|nr:cyclopropane-fatty-acyl-phospholipid synthase family protein [Gammaproteobacteria bacterium]
MNTHQWSDSSQATLSSKRVRGFEQWALKKYLNTIGDPPVRIVLWDGDSFTTNDTTPVGTIYIKDRSTLYGLLVNPELSFGEAYIDGSMEIEGDLPNLLAHIFRGQRNMSESGTVARLLCKQGMRRPRRNTKSGSRHNIHQHYDIGNEFYKLWLDERMQYTCAYFSSPDLTIEQAQIAKLDHICRKLQIRPGDRVVEAGCGWGSLALHIARHYGAKVKAYNISTQQIKYARERAVKEGMNDMVEYIEDDYRNIKGDHDVFVSVGMLEHVGPQNYRELGDVIDRCLKEDGRGLLHSIGRNKPRMMNAWIEERIFPGAYPPTLRQMMDVFEPHYFSVLDVENLRLHYAATIEHWLQRYQQSESKVTEMFDEKFVRAWRLYLAGSIAVFKANSLQLFQILFAREGHPLPITRDYMYPS